MELHGQSLVAGVRTTHRGRSFRAIDPATGETLAPDFHEASEAEAAQAMEAAAAAFADYRRTPPEVRAEFLEQVAAGIEALGDALVTRAVAETGLPAARITGERGRTCGQLRLFAQVVREGSWVDARIDTAQPQRQPAPRPDIRRMLVPLGPVVVFGSSNFPLAFSTAGGDTASALAVGCPVVVKAHGAHPGTGELVGEAIAAAAARTGLPAGVFSMLHGEGATLGQALVRHPAAAAVGFTGSHAAGRALFDAASRREKPIPVFAEMSSLNPVFLLPEALATRGEALAQGLVDSFTLGVGQFCTKPGLVFALRGDAADAFLARLAACVQAAPCGTLLGPGIRRNFEANRGLVLAKDGVRLLAASTATIEAGRVGATPSVALTDAQHFLAQPELATEAFGPFTLVVLAQDMRELLACAAALPGQLTATVHGTEGDLAAAGALLDTATQVAGRLIINGFPTGVEVCAAMNHGGPYPATTDARFTSVGTAALQRFVRPVCYQGFADALLPPELKDANPRGILRLVDGQYTREPLRRP
ncbi:MAG: aldehyde dehydrogenase (NADP(+)) [Pseudomonadota bacterium]|jgi:alpha-ketoglutaric semialdehyde dehydrogenase|nr:MAG: aldehyde dehydrogenase (NADP(+)) [Pseudomonadota bacterium]